MPELTYDDEMIETRGGAFAHPPSHISAMGVEPGMIVADFGAGSGAHVFPLAEAVGADGHVYAIDVQRDLLKRIKNEANRRKHTHVDVLWGDLETPGGSKLGDDFVDIVLMSNLLFQLTDQHAPLVEARRILKPAGTLAIIDWQARSFDDFDTPYMGPHRHYSVSRDEAIDLALRSGFEPIGEIDAGAHHYGIVFRAINDSIPSLL